MKNKFYQVFCLAVLLLLTVSAMLVVVTDKRSSRQITTTIKISRSSSAEKKRNVPNVSSTDWELILVNRDHIHAEMNPQLTEVAGISVDSRIAENVQSFLAAAQAIDPNEHLISGYRSFAYQEEIYASYIQQEMAADPSLSQVAAEAKVQTYSQPAGASEHMTGLAIDMSTVDTLNESDPAVVAKVQAIASEYGFVLRFQGEKTSSTGIGYEDWHYRYVGVTSAKYMTEHNLSLEEYLELLQQNSK
ncbi:D-alanyl-D-alanine carboxypeptidase family protein [Streptococcus gallolyticus]|nr:D-alanyl-D-alanine carboxypeptidase family protein [Streptococcus gallolyticus]MBY5040341.1 D-alanyl-D-alanine carboxypeptidase family protein [Streptococcus gallolyticus]